MLVYGLENVVDFLSSCVVLWRFYCPGGLTKEREEMLENREKRANLAISVILMMLGVAVVFTSAHDLVKQQTMKYELKSQLYFSIFSVFIFGAMCILKFQFSWKLNSPSLQKDAFCSLIGCTLALALSINTFVIDNNPQLWWIDPTIALLCGVASFFVGFHALIVARFIEGLPICSCGWWLLSHGDDSVERKATADADLELTEEDEEGKVKTKLSNIV